MNWFDKKIWKQCFIATFICLIGCSIGTMGTSFYFFSHSKIFVLILSLILGFISCVVFIILWKFIFQKKSFKESLKSSFKMSIVSMLIMMLTENGIILFIVPQFFLHKMHLNSEAHLILMLLAMSFGFIFSMPYNYYQLYKTGKTCH